MTAEGRHILEDFESPEVTDDEYIGAADAIFFSYDEAERNGERP